MQIEIGQMYLEPVHAARFKDFGSCIFIVNGEVEYNVDHWVPCKVLYSNGIESSSKPNKAYLKSLIRLPELFEIVYGDQ